MKEIWSKIENYNSYEVSNNGRVKSLKYNKVRILNQEDCRGYLRVSLSKHNVIKRFLVHRLVCFSFVKKGEPHQVCVNHKDGNKHNNRVSNLEWVSYSENEIHSYTVLNKINSQRKLNLKAIKDIRDNCVKGVNQNNKGNVHVFMERYNVDRGTVLNVLNKKYYA